MNIWLAIVLTLIAAGGVGFINGYMVMTTKLPSFIVTLATFFILQGVNLGVTKAITNQVAVSNIDSAAGYESANKIFGGSFWSPHDFRDHGPVVDRDHRRSRPGSSRARAWATGSSASAATRTPRATSASRSRA